ncbi:MAG: phage tail protein [Veillonellaceae bacterium]|nr:phage tail protein [Veillonellaceae bacterium]MDY4485586.1 phage tail protein [Anaerovibrio sp.]MDY5330569.1 phage tail protein [Anaerovibrio sp.]
MIEVDARGIEQAQELLKDIPGATKKAVSTALRKSLRNAKKEAVKKVRERYTIRKAGYVSRTIKMKVENMTGILSSKGPVNDLSYFKTNPKTVPKRRPPKGKYLYSQVVKGQGGTIAHAFLAKMKSGHVGVFQRAGHGASNASLPISKLAGPSTPQMLGSPSVTEFIAKKMLERMDKNLEHEIDAFLKGYRR